MTQLPTPLQIIGIAIRCQYLSNAAIRNSLTYDEKPIDQDLPVKLYVERKGLQWMYNNNPSNPLLVQLANYVLSLCGGFLEQAQTIIGNLTKALPIVTGPTNQSVLVGQNATFSVSVVSSLPVIYQWYLNNAPIIGAISSSYTVSDAQLTDSGDTLYVKVASAAGTVTSNTVTLTVTENITGQLYAGATDYSSQLLAGDSSIPWNGTFSITNGQPLIVGFPAGQVLYIAVQYPDSQSVKVSYANPTGGIDTGGIPGLALDTNAFGGNNYIFSNPGSPFGINNTSGIVTLS